MSAAIPAFDVIAIGEVLVEVATDSAFAHGVPAMLGISGDALNVAASAAAAGASVGLLAVLTEDELGHAIAARVAELGISTELLRFRRGQQGVYLVHSDPDGEREFSYARSGSVGSTLGVDDIDDAVLRAAGAVIASGIACAISATTRELVLHAAATATRFVYDPNFRPRLTDAAVAAADLARIAASAAVITPSFPGETTALLQQDSPLGAAEALLDAGTGTVAVTCGSRGIQLASAEGELLWIDAIPAPRVVDQTGAGDAFVGTLTARIVLGDALADAARLAAAAASLVVGGRGGTGFVPTLAQTREHAGGDGVSRLSLSTHIPVIPRVELSHGIVHLGIGAFARAHTAVLTEDAMLATGDTRWGITAVSGRSDTVVRQLGPQDGLFTVAERGVGSGPARVVSSVTRAIAGRTDPEAVLKRIAEPATAVVTLTITEKGYRSTPGTARLDSTDADIRADLAGAPAVTPIGQIARGLQRRASRDAGPITIVSCDNLPGNGALTRALVLDFVAALPTAESEALHDWIAENARFPSTMVDRMVPATTPADLDAIESEIGLRDEAGVVAEPFRQWVIEDDFAAARPPWGRAGATFTDDVEPWESAKLRLLNASHSVLAYLGLAAGMSTIADSVADPAFRLAAERMMAEDALPTISVPAQLDADDYTASVIRRFANPALGHTNAKVGSDGSQKIGLRLLSTIEAALATGHEPRWATLGVAAWMHRVAEAETLDDPLAGALRALLPGGRSAESVVPALLRSTQVFHPELAANETFVSLLTDWYRTLDRHGVDGLRREIIA